MPSVHHESAVRLCPYDAIKQRISCKVREAQQPTSWLALRLCESHEWQTSISPDAQDMFDDGGPLACFTIKFLLFIFSLS